MAVIDRRLELRFPNNDHETITGHNIIAESMVLTRSICDDEFRLGGCIATSFELQLIDVSPYTLDGKRIQAVLLEYTDDKTVPLIPNDTLYPSDTLYPGRTADEPTEEIIFTGTIDSLKRQQHRQVLKLIAYDDIYTIMQKNVYTWLWQRAYYAKGEKLATVIETLFDVALQNKIPYKTRWQTFGNNTNYNTATQLSHTLVDECYKNNITACEVLRSANELMGCFGYITGDGYYNTLRLAKDKVYNIERFESLEFEEYETAEIDIVSFTYNNDDTAFLARKSSTNSCYRSEDNVITNCTRNKSEVLPLLKKLTQGSGGLADGAYYSYRPFTLTAYKETLPKGIGLGSRVHIITGSTAIDDIRSVDSIVLAEKITGIRTLKYELSAEGEKILGGYDENAEG
jgi:hypothetical protein